MTFLPIVNRELRVASRRRGTYWSRCLTALLTILTGFVVYLYNFTAPPHQTGVVLFYVISYAEFIYCLFVGVRFTADCLSEEKREGTLGLLFLTDLKGYDVVVGKLVATSLNAFYGILAILPVLALPLLMGGMTNGELWRMALVLTNTFFFSLAAGMFMSALNKSSRAAMGLTLLFLLACSLGLLMVWAFIPFINQSHGLSLLCWLFNPGFSASRVPDMIFKTDQKHFWWSVGIFHASAWLFLILASVIVPRSWQDHPPVGNRGRWRRWELGDAASRAAFRRRLLGINPFFWLASRSQLRPLFVWAALVVLACLWTWGAFANGRYWLDPGNYVVTSIILNSMLKVWIASEAGRRFGDDRKLGALELILSTPLTVRDILRGQLLALRRQFLGPTIAVMAVEFVFYIASLKDIGATDVDCALAAVAWWAAGNIMLLADMLTLSAVGMWVGLSAKNPNRATGITLARVIVLPLGATAAIFIFSGVLSELGFIHFDPGWKFFLAAWFVPGIVVDAFFGLRAWRRLCTEFRETATQRFAPRPSLLRRLFRPGAAGLPHAGVETV
jgi:ABC-type Na+ efflux pump permease subunit